jgi:hypothetical protein
MNHPRWQALASLGFVGCMMPALSLMGCSSVTIYHYPGQENHPHVPESTEQRLKQCVEELKDDINAGFYSVDVKVSVDEDGNTVGVETEGMPNPNVGTCMRIALQGMRLPQDVVERGMLRTSASANGETLPDRGQIGEIVTITVVTIVFTEIVIEAVAITIGVTVTATVAAGVAERFARRKGKKRSCSDHVGECLMSPLASQPGTGPKHSLCHDCWMLCENGKWPKHVDQASRGQVSCYYGPGADE